MGFVKAVVITKNLPARKLVLFLNKNLSKKGDVFINLKILSFKKDYFRISIGVNFMGTLLSFTFCHCYKSIFR